MCGSLAGQAAPVSLCCQLNLQWATEPAQNKYVPPFNQGIIWTYFSFGRHLKLTRVMIQLAGSSIALQTAVDRVKRSATGQTMII